MARAVNQTMAWVISVVLATIGLGLLLGITSYVAEKYSDEKHAEIPAFTSPASDGDDSVIRSDDFDEKKTTGDSVGHEADHQNKKKTTSMGL